MPDIGSISLTFRAGAPRLMAAGRRLLSAVVLGLVAVGLPASAAGHDGITGVFVEPDRVNPGGVVVVRGDNVSTDDPIRVELIAGVTRIELGTAVTDGEGHFTIGAAIPPETAVGPYAIEVSGQSGVRMSVDLLVEGSPFYDGQNGAPPGRDEGLPAMPSLERPDPGPARRSAARCRGSRSRSRPAGGARACGGRVRRCSRAGADDQPGPRSVRPTCPSIVR